MNTWTLVTTAGNGSNPITNGHPQADLYGGTFIYVGTVSSNKVYTVCTLLQPQNDITGAVWQIGNAAVVAPTYTPNSNTTIQCLDSITKPHLYPINVVNTTVQNTDSLISGSFSYNSKPFSDIHPLSDYFESNLTETNWTKFQPTLFNSFISDGKLNIIANPTTGDSLRGLIKALPDGDCTIISKLELVNPKGGFGLALLQDGTVQNTTDIIFCGYYRDDINYTLLATKFSDYNTFSTDVIANEAISKVYYPSLYVRLSRSNTTWTFSYSNNGNEWITKGTFTEASHFKPKHFGLLVDNVDSVTSNTTGHYKSDFLYFHERNNASLQGGSIGNLKKSRVNTRIITVGDSITEGLLIGENYSYPNQLAKLLNASSIGYSGNILIPDDTKKNTEVLNVGHDAYTNQQILDLTLPNLLLRRNSKLIKDTIILFSGSNDLATGVSASTAYSRLSTIINNLTSVGYAVYVCTIIDRNGSSSFDTSISSFNSLITGNGANANKVINLAADSRLQDASNTTYYLPDGIHLNSNGCSVVANLVFQNL